MSPQLVIIVVIFLAWIFSQFGGRLSAKNALGWWGAAVLLTLATLAPGALTPLAAFLGVSLVSNFVMAALIFFLFFHAMQSQSITTDLGQKLRELGTSLAAQTFVKKRSQVRMDPTTKALILLPCYNEEANLKSIIHQLNALIASHPGQFDYCFINDCSRDRSEDLLELYAAQHFTSHQANMGVSGGLLTGFKIARHLGFAYVIQCDSDGQHPVHEIPRILDHAHQGGYDLTIGSRFRGCSDPSERKANHKSTTSLRRFGSMTIRAALSLFGKNAMVADPTSGFRVYSSKAISILACRMPEEYPEPESIAILANQGARIAEVYVTMQPRDGGRSSLLGLNSARFMIKVVTALVGLRIRTASIYRKDAPRCNNI